MAQGKRHLGGPPSRAMTIERRSGRLRHHSHQRQRVAVGVLEGAQLELVRLGALDGLGGAQEHDALGFQSRAERVDVGGVEIEHAAADGAARLLLLADHQAQALELEEEHVAGFEHQGESQSVAIERARAVQVAAGERHLHQLASRQIRFASHPSLPRIQLGGHTVRLPNYFSGARQVAASNVEKTADLLHSAAIRLLRYVRKEDAASGITGAQLSVLSVLVFAGPQTLGALAQAEQVRPPTMSQLVGELERRGLAQRRPLDRRSIQVSVTEKGRRLLEAGRRRRLARLTNALSDLRAEDLQSLAKAAQLII